MGVFSGDTFCVSGAFSISQNEMKELVVKNGAHIATTPNKSCTYLVADSIGSSKTMKAEKDGIPIVTEEWVQKSIKAGKKSTDASLFLSGGPSGSGGKSAATKAGSAKKKSKKSEDDDDDEEEDESTNTLKGVGKSTPTTPFPSFIKNVPGLYAILRTRYDHVEIWVIQNEGNVQAIEEMTQRFQTNLDEEFEYEWLKQNQTEAQARAVVQKLKAGGGGGGDEDDEEEDDSEEMEVFWIRHPIDLEKLRKAEFPSMIMLDWKDDGEPEGEGGKQDADEDEDEEDEENAKPKKKAPAAKKSAAGGGGSVFSGEVFCVSGSFSVSQAEMRKLIITNGGDVVDTPNKKCTYLVADSIGSSKTMKAQKDGIKIVTEAWVNDSIAKGKKSTDKKFFLSGGGDDDDMDDEEDSKPSKKKKTPAKRKAEDDDDDEDEEDEDGPKKKSAKSSKKSATSGPSSSSHIKKVIVKGSAPVDDLCPVHNTTHVYSPSKSEVYDCMLNQTDIGSNANKFYVIQLLESDSSPKKYSVWTRWGRVGYPGQNNLDLFDSNVAAAIKSFEGKFYDKTKNRWSDRANFESVKGKYTLLERDYSADNDDEEDEDDEDAPKVKAKSKKSASAPTIKKNILWIDPNNLANNKEHLDAVGIDRVESVASEAEAIAWLNAQLKHHPKLLTQIKIVSNMARMESGVFQPQAGIATTIKLNQMGVPFENVLVYTSQERAKGKFPPNVRITYDDDELTKFLAPASSADDDDDDDGEKDDEEDDEGDEKVGSDPKGVPGSIKVTPVDPALYLDFSGAGHGRYSINEYPAILYTNYKPALAGAPIAKYRTVRINKERVILFDARPENLPSIQLIQDAFAALLKSNESKEDDFDMNDSGAFKHYYKEIESLEWFSANRTKDSAKYKTQAEIFDILRKEKESGESKCGIIVIINQEWDHDKLKRQLTADPLSIDTAVFQKLTDYLKPDSPVHAPSFVPKVADKKYQLVWWSFEDITQQLVFLDARDSNLKAIERLRESMGKPWEENDAGYSGGWLTKSGQPVTEEEGRKLILSQRFTSETMIDFWIGQFKTKKLFKEVAESEDEIEQPFIVLGGDMDVFTFEQAL